jgi:hypothetical protein
MHSQSIGHCVQKPATQVDSTIVPLQIRPAAGTAIDPTTTPQTPALLLHRNAQVFAKCYRQAIEHTELDTT